MNRYRSDIKSTGSIRRFLLYRKCFSSPRRGGWLPLAIAKPPPPRFKGGGKVYSVGRGVPTFQPPVYIFFKDFKNLLGLLLHWHLLYLFPYILFISLIVRLI